MITLIHSGGLKKDKIATVIGDRAMFYSCHPFNKVGGITHHQYSEGGKGEKKGSEKMSG